MPIAKGAKMGKSNFIKDIWTIIRVKADNFDTNWVGQGSEEYQPTLSKSILLSIIAAVGIMFIFALLVNTKPEIFPENASNLVQDLFLIVPNAIADLVILIYQFCINKYMITSTGANIGRWFICHGISIFVLGLLIAKLAVYFVVIIIGIFVGMIVWRMGISILFGNK